MSKLLKGTVKHILRTVHKLGIHKFIYDKIFEIKKEHERLPYIHDYQQLIPERPIPLATSEYWPLLKNSLYYKNGIYTQPELFICEIENPLIHFNTGTLATIDGCLIAESDMNENRLKESRVYGDFIRSPTVSLKGFYTTLMTKYKTDYAHWMIDVLPRAYGLWHWKGETPTILMPAETPEKFRSILQYCVPEGIPIKYDRYEGWGEIERFVFVSYAVNNQSAYYPVEVRDFLRDKIFSALSIVEDHLYQNRIYIARRGDKRRLINEDEIVKYLSDLNFHVYELEDLSFEAQVRLFHDAEVVIAPHGAGLVNLLFSGPDTQILEFFGTEHPLTWYYLLAQAMGQPYHYLYSRELVGRHDNFSIDLDDVKHLVRQIFDV